MKTNTKPKQFKIRNTFKVAETVSNIRLSIAWLKADIRNLKLADSLMKKISEVRTNEISHHK